MADFVFTGGGTGGHLYPALAVADALKKLKPGADVLFVGTPDRIEARVVPAAGYRFQAIASQGLSRNPVAAIKALSLLGLAVIKASGIIKFESPRVVLGTGGYVSAPVLLAAKLAGVPVVLQEQNVVPGKVNRWIARWADVVATSFASSERFFGAGNLKLVGNPIRKDAFVGSPESARESLGLPADARVLLVTGGSQGAQRLNRAVAGALPRILETPGWQVIHIAGANNVSEFEHLRSERYHLLGYCEQMPQAILASNLVISRAGATTLAELTAMGRPAILVPYPFAGGHQRLNAEALVDAGAAIEIPDAELTPDRLGEVLFPLLQDEGRLQAMAAASEGQGRPDAADAVAQILLDLARVNGT